MLDSKGVNENTQIMTPIRVKNIEKYTHIREGETVAVCQARMIYFNEKKQTQVGASKSNYTPLLVSPTEDIEVGCKFLSVRGLIEEAIIHYPVGENRRKILVFPENLSPEHMLWMASGHMQNGSKVLLECEPIGDEWQVKLNPGGCVTMFLLKPMTQQPAPANETWDDFYGSMRPILKKYNLDNIDACIIFKLAEDAGYNPPTKRQQ